MKKNHVLTQAAFILDKIEYEGFKTRWKFQTLLLGINFGLIFLLGTFSPFFLIREFGANQVVLTAGLIIPFIVLGMLFTISIISSLLTQSEMKIMLSIRKNAEEKQDA